MITNVIGFSYKNLKPDLVLTLPMPPSVNECYSNTTHPARPRVKSEKYKEWIKLATDALWTQKKTYLTGPIAVVYSFYVPDKRKRDCANYEKCLSDFLVGNSLIEDDRLIRWNLQEWLDDEATNTGVIVKVWKI